jgi:hypothetical protein
MLSNTVSPKTKAELIRALQAASFRSVEVFEADRLSSMPSADQLKRVGATMIMIR